MNASGSSSLWMIFWSAVTVVVFAELGCLARTSALAVRYGQPWVIFAGTMVGTAITMGAGILMGHLVRSHVPDTWLRLASGVFFLIFGALLLAGRLEG